MFHGFRALTTVFATASLTVSAADFRQLSSNVRLLPGSINAAFIQQGDQTMAVYGGPSRTSPKPAMVLFTHHRRDVVETGRHLVEQGTAAVVPELERSYFESPDQHWAEFSKIRLVDAAQQTTKMLTRPLPVTRGVTEGDVINFGKLRFDVVSTPGFTRDAVSYIADIDGRKFAFTGDLIYGDGQIFDLYSFQDRIPEAKIGGYHGYGARLAQLLESLAKIEALAPDFIVPARGPAISEPATAIRKLRERVRRLYRNYLSTNALYWYFKEDRMRACAERILGPDPKFDLMPYSRHEEMPDWVMNTGTTRVILSESGAAFMLDCGSERYIQFVKDLMRQGIVKRIEGIFVTHYHGDHTHHVQRAAEEFDCPVYAIEEYADILEHPEAWHMPAGTPYSIKDIIALRDDTTVRWHEYEFTFRFFPGQTLLHGALLVQKANTKPIFFIGDAFTPSGLDDYCVQNRNLLHEDTGYLKCLKMVRDYERQLGGLWLMNEHVAFVFDYTEEQKDYLEQRYRERISILKELLPWDDPNYGIDEQWAWFYPYGAEVKAGGSIRFKFRFYNHSPKARDMRVTPNLPDGFSLSPGALSVRVPPRTEVSLPLQVEVGKTVKPGLHILTADITTDAVQLHQWSEAIITVTE